MYWLNILGIHFRPLLAHEAYVLTRDQFRTGLNSTTSSPLGPLFQTTNLKMFLIISVCVAISYVLAVLWSTTPPAAKLDAMLKRLAMVGPLIIRLAISASFFYAAYSNSVFGPEISLAGILGGPVIRYLLFLLAIMILIGFLTELAALVAMIMMIYVAARVGGYIFTYLNYFGELLVLVLFGSRFLSLDGYLFGKKSIWRKLSSYSWLETPIIRVCYGLALIFAGISVKFQYQALTVIVYNEYHLGQYFHLPAAMVAAGAGLAEVMIGFFILTGLAMRWTIIISLAFITLSLLYFHEMLWPHLMLYGISFSLLINSGDRLSIDRYMVPWARRVRKAIIGI